jgi:predicted metal-dependent enzyme (double-stranded beta helix superfamily)
MFDLNEFVASCQAALKEHAPQLAAKQLMEQTMANPGDVEAALGTPTAGGITTLHRSDDLTVINVIWPPGMTIFPHDHRIWAVIGIYGGQEDNTFFRRSHKGLDQAGFKALDIKDSVGLGPEAIHAVHNPRSLLTGAIHVYGGDFFAEPRSEWDPETLVEQPYDMEHAMRAFSEANDAWLARQDNQ